MKSIVYLITSYGMGKTSEQPLSHKLVTTFLTLVPETDNKPSAICFYTDGVKLACEGSPVLEQLQKLESIGVRLVLCQTCLKYFDLEEKVKVGIIGGMGDILSYMSKADSVVTI